MADLDRAANAAGDRGDAARWCAKRSQAGAIGLSTGTFYPPAVKATTEEIIEVGRPLTERTAASTSPTCATSPTEVMESLDETFRIGRELGVPVVVSHHKVQNTPNFGRSTVTLALHPRGDEGTSASASTAIRTPPARP